MSTLAPTGTLRVGASDLEYRMIGPAPDSAPTIVMLHEGLGSAAMWGAFPEKLQAATGAGVFAYSRAGYGASSPVKLPRPMDYMNIEALDVQKPVKGLVSHRVQVRSGEVGVGDAATSVVDPVWRHAAAQAQPIGRHQRRTVGQADHELAQLDRLGAAG